MFENIKKTKQTTKVDQFLTLKRTTIGPVFNFTVAIYIYIERYVERDGERKKNTGRKIYRDVEREMGTDGDRDRERDDMR